MKKLVIIPNGWPCTLLECPPGFFVFEDRLCLKTEYAYDGPYNEGGEVFWGGVDTKEERAKLIVEPVDMEWQEVDP